MYEINDFCGHPRLTEVNDFIGIKVDVSGQKGNVTGMFTWKKYTCDSCKKLITVLQAVVENIDV